MSYGFGLMIESLVAFLLLLTIGYCVILNSRPQAPQGRRAGAQGHDLGADHRHRDRRPRGRRAEGHRAGRRPHARRTPQGGGTPVRRGVFCCRLPPFEISPQISTFLASCVCTRLLPFAIIRVWHMGKGMEGIMARTIARLKPRQVANAKPKRGRTATLLADGGNLYLQVTAGSGGSQRQPVMAVSLRAGWPSPRIWARHVQTISLAEARQRARSLRQQLIDGIDPLTARHQERDQRRLATAKAMSFGDCVTAYLEAHDAGWRNAKHRDQWRMTLTNYCKPISGLPIAQVDTDLVLRVLTPLWTTRTETAKRLRGRIERVLSWAKGRGLRDGENPARWSGHLDEMLAKPSRCRFGQASRRRALWRDLGSHGRAECARFRIRPGVGVHRARVPSGPVRPAAPGGTK